MTYHEKNKGMRAGLQDAHDEIRSILAYVHRKTAMPYGDGTRDNMINAGDIILRLGELDAVVTDCMDRVT